MRFGKTFFSIPKLLVVVGRVLLWLIKVLVLDRLKKGHSKG